MCFSIVLGWLSTVIKMLGALIMQRMAARPTEPSVKVLRFITQPPLLRYSSCQELLSVQTHVGIFQHEMRARKGGEQSILGCRLGDVCVSSSFCQIIVRCCYVLLSCLHDTSHQQLRGQVDSTETMSNCRSWVQISPQSNFICR